MSRALALLGVLIALPAVADWRFEPPLELAGPARAGVFHHLESAGRRSLAAGERWVAVTWEDNRDGRPRAYAAFKRIAARDVEVELRLSGPGEAYEPAVAVLGGGRFLFAWEEDGRVRARVGEAAGLGPAVTLEGAGAQVSLAPAGAGRAYAAWIRRQGRFGHVMVALVEVDGDRPRILWRRPVEPQPPESEQLYPALALGGAGLVVGWEDRRHGHTRLYTARLEGDAFTAPVGLNDQPSGPRRVPYGRGSGVTRLALAAAGSVLAAAWMDKRDFRGGYDIYGALSTDGGRSFGPNERVQDLFGENQPQWHPAVAVAPEGRVVVVWDDPRDGDADLWLSWREDGEWSDDMAVPGAHGPGEQASPSLAFDAEGGLHLAWVERHGAGSVLRYAYAPPGGP